MRKISKSDTQSFSNHAFSPVPEAVLPLNKLYVTDVSLADLLDTSRSTVWRYVKIGILPPPVKIGGLTRFDVAQVMERLSDFRRKDVSSSINVVSGVES